MFFAVSAFSQSIESYQVELKSMYEKAYETTISDDNFKQYLETTQEALAVWKEVHKYHIENVQPYNSQRLERIIEALEMKLN